VKVTEPIESSSSIKATCPTCGGGFNVGSLSVASQITNHGCQDCRDNEFKKGDDMAKAVIKGEPKKETVKEIIRKNPQLVKGNGKTSEHPAVKDAKSKKIEVQPKFDEVKDPEQVKNPLIEKYAIEKKKISRDKVALMAEEAKLDANIRELLAAQGLTHYRSDEVDVELVPTKDKLKIKILDDEEEED
jgi:hypothetical protein